MCMGGGGSTPPPAAAPPPPKAAAPVTAMKLSKSSARKAKVDRTGSSRRRGSARKTLVIPKSGIQYSGSGSGVNV